MDAVDAGSFVSCPNMSFRPDLDGSEAVEALKGVQFGVSPSAGKPEQNIPAQCFVRRSWEAPVQLTDSN